MAEQFFLKPYQSEFYNSTAMFCGFVAAWGTGKSRLAIQKCVRLSEKYPKNLIMIMRKEFTDLKDSTIQDYEKYTGQKVNSGRNVVFPNGSIIMFRHLEEMGGNNLQNVNLGAFWIEQAEELETIEPFNKLLGRLRRSGIGLRQGMITANTKGHNWIWKLWKQGDGIDEMIAGLAAAGRKVTRENLISLSEATTFDNQANLPDDFFIRLELIKATQPAVYRRYVMNSYEDADTIDCIIQPQWIEAAINRILPKLAHIKRITSLDVARFGDDKCVCKVLENCGIVFEDKWEKKDTMWTTGRAIEIHKRWLSNMIGVDELNMGAGVCDRMMELNQPVTFVNSGDRQNIDKTRYLNKRSAMWANGADKFYKGEVSITNNPTLIEDLQQMRYKTLKSDGIMQAEDKQDFKKRVKRSPDDGDCFIQGLWVSDESQYIDDEYCNNIYRPQLKGRQGYA